MSGAEAYFLASFILIHSTVWPQCTNVTDRQDRPSGQRSDSIGRIVLQTVAQKSLPLNEFLKLAYKCQSYDQKLCFWDPVLITGSIASSATRRYLSYSDADFEVFRPTGATRCTYGGEIWHGGNFLRAKIHRDRYNGKGIGPPKLKFLLRFDQNVEYKSPAGAYPLRDFHKISRVCTPFQDTLAVKISLDLLKGLWSHGGFKLTMSGYHPIFSTPLRQNYASDPQKF